MKPNSCLRKPRRGGCAPTKFAPTSLDAIVKRYIDKHQGGAQEELDIFRNQRSFRECIREAGLARRWDEKEKRWKRLHHQRRIPSKMLQAWTAVLLRRAERIRGCQTFQELFAILEREAQRFWKNGELTVYDTALRIGAHRQLEPRQVFLHRGTREGAKALKIGSGRKSIMPNELPREFRRLKPREIEDCLCIYKRHLAKLLVVS